MNIETGFLSCSLRRSLSCDNIPCLLEDKMTSPNIPNGNYFNRQGAMRKRTQNSDASMYKKHSIMEFQNIVMKHSISNEDGQCLKDQDNLRKRKNSVITLGAIKELWKSMTGYSKEKDEMKRKPSDVRSDLNYSFVPASEISGFDINSFLNRMATKVCEITFSPVITIESSLLEIVERAKILSKIEVDRQAAIWEIIDTEANFIKQLSIVVNIFYPVLQELLSCYHNELPDIRLEDVFGNIKELYLNHWALWDDCISLPLQLKKINDNILDISPMKEGFCGISNVLNSYVYFMHRLPSMRNTINKLQKGSSIFNQYIEWTQTYDRQCHEGHMCILTLPFQRITRYRMLLERVKSLWSPVQQNDIDEMIESVHNFVQQINLSIVGKYTMQDIKEKLVDASVTNVLYPDINKLVTDEEWNFDILTPLFGFHKRILIHEGRLKMKIGSIKMSDVQCYLCNDLFMVCQPVKGNWNRLKIFKTPIRLDKLRVDLIRDDSEGCFVITVFNDFRVVDSMIVMFGFGDDVKLWVDKCNKTKLAFVSQYSEICSANESMYSTDSAFSQGSGSSTPVDYFGTVNTISPLRNLSSQKSKSMDNMVTINEEYLCKFYPEHETILSVDFGEGSISQ